MNVANTDPSSPAPEHDDPAALDAAEAASEPGLLDEAPVTGRPLAWQARLLFVLALVATLAALFMPHTGDSLAPNANLFDDSGRPTTLGAHMTPVVLLHFWATWCPPCITEIPALQRLAQDFTGRAGFQVMMIAVQDDPAKTMEFVGGRAFSVFHDPDWQVAHRYGTRKLPETYLIVNNQKVELKLDGPRQDRFIGATNWDDPAIRAMLEEVLRKVAAGEEVTLASLQP